MRSILLVLAGLMALTTARADILRLRDGRMFTGEFLGATKDQIWFRSDAPGGIIGPAAYATAEVESLTFGPDAKQSKTAVRSPATPPSRKNSEWYTRGSREPQKTDSPATQ